jgi:hypothetical protein
MQSRPVIIQKAVNVGPRYLTLDDPNVVTTKSFSHFNIMNTGNGPAIELEMSLLDKDKNTIYSHRETYLKAGDEIEFSGALLFNHPESKFYLLCQYNATFALNTRKIWYQTWLPLEVSRGTSKKIFVAPGELVFCEVNEKDRVISFVSKPS